MTPAERQLELNRLKDRWWWFDAPVSQRTVAAESWELLRRTRIYCQLWNDCWPVVTREQRDKSPPLFIPVYQSELRLAAGERFGAILLAGCNPNLTWPELKTHQRREIEDRLPFLPRQRLELVPLLLLPFRVGLVELKRDRTGKGFPYPILCPDPEAPVYCVADWYGGVPNYDHPGHVAVLPSNTDEMTFVVITFDFRASRESLIRDLDSALAELLKFDLSALKTMEHWKALAKEEKIYPADKEIKVKGKSVRQAVWQPSSHDDDTPHFADDVLITPTNDFPFVRCWINPRKWPHSRVPRWQCLGVSCCLSPQASREPPCLKSARTRSSQLLPRSTSVPTRHPP
jgi:hypothetical protein